MVFHRNSAVVYVAAVVTPPVCPGLNTTRFAPMGCQKPNACCKLNQQDYKCSEDSGCTVCPECCHSNFAPANLCSRCVSQSCGYWHLSSMGCQINGTGGCCGTLPLAAAKTRKNCLLIGLNYSWSPCRLTLPVTALYSHC